MLSILYNQQIPKLGIACGAHKVSASSIRCPHSHWLKHNSESSIQWIQGVSVSRHMYCIMSLCYSLDFQHITCPRSVHVLIPTWTWWLLRKYYGSHLRVLHVVSFRVLIIYSKCFSLTKAKWIHFIKQRFLIFPWILCQHVKNSIYFDSFRMFDSKYCCFICWHEYFQRKTLIEFWFGIRTKFLLAFKMGLDLLLPFCTYITEWSQKG